MAHKHAFETQTCIRTDIKVKKRLGKKRCCAQNKHSNKHEHSSAPLQHKLLYVIERTCVKPKARPGELPNRTTGQPRLTERDERAETAKLQMRMHLLDTWHFQKELRTCLFHFFPDAILRYFLRFHGQYCNRELSSARIS